MEEATLLSAVVAVNDALLSSPDHTVAYLRAVEVVRSAADAADAVSFLLDEGRVALRLVADEAARAQLEALGLTALPAKEHVRLPWVTKDEWPVQVIDHVDSPAWRDLPEEFRAWFGRWGVVVPLWADGRHSGAILLPATGPYPLPPQRRAFLAACGRVVGAALHRWHVAARERELGALKERRRLGDDLHVDLSQQIAALGLLVGSARHVAGEGGASGAGPELDHELDRLESAVTGTKKSLRHLMLGLRADADLVDGSLTRTLTAQAASMRTLLGIESTYLCSDHAAADALPLTVAAQLVRVVQEALANSRLHAQPSRVDVRLDVAHTRVQLVVEDDGVGFKRDLTPSTRLGLRIMQERMEQVGGTVEHEAVPGGGTRVVARAPLRPDEITRANLAGGRR